MRQTLIISDVHGNQPALTAVLRHVYRYYKPDEIWCLGDIAGYGPHTEPVWKALRNLLIPPGGWVAGNHDCGLIGRLNGPRILKSLDLPGASGINPQIEYRISHFRELAWAVLEKQKELLSNKPELLSHLGSLPLMSSPRLGVYLAHGSFIKETLGSVLEYTNHLIVSPSGMVENFRHAAQNKPKDIYQGDITTDSLPRLFAFGHTHIPALWRWSPDKNQEWRSLNYKWPHRLGNLDESPLALNPGSVGFPRSGTGCPTYALIDWEKGIVFFRQVRYDPTETLRDMGVPPYSDLLAEPGFWLPPAC
jgi:predicted phosphodiesterase